MKRLAPGDVVDTTAVDRLSRDTTDLLVIARDMQRAGAGIRSLAEPVVDTTSDLPSLSLPCLAVQTIRPHRDLIIKEPDQIRSLVLWSRSVFGVVFVHITHKFIFIRQHVALRGHVRMVNFIFFPFIMHHLTGKTTGRCSDKGVVDGVS